jgi:alkylation response protein AidB-like acyl-CoA dehydrogenase
VDFTIQDDLAAHEARARAWFEANFEQEWADDQYHTGSHQTMELHRRMAEEGLLGAGWPKEYGGTDVDPDFVRAVYREYVNADIRMDAWMTTVMVLHTILALGTEEQKQHFVGGAMRGEILISLGYSEPESGSDVAAAKTKATRDGDEWVIDGQKMFTSTAEKCSHVIVLARTDPDLPKHKGLTMFLVPTDVPGFEVQPIHTLGNQRTNTTYYSGVRIPDSLRLAGVNEGWSVIRTALVYERGVGMPYKPIRVGEHLAEWAQSTTRPDGTRPFDDPQVTERLGRMATESEVARLLAGRLDWMVARDKVPSVEGSMSKMFRSETDQRHYRDALDVLGAEGLLAPGAPGAPRHGTFEFGFRSSVVETIYGGASEIMREMIAEGRLKLPRNRGK